MSEYADTFGRGAAFAGESQSIDALLTELIGQSRFTVDGVVYDARLGFQQVAKDVERIVRYGFGALADGAKDAGDEVRDASEQLGRIKDAGDRFAGAVDKFADTIGKGKNPQFPEDSVRRAADFGIPPGAYLPGVDRPQGGGGPVKVEDPAVRQLQEELREVRRLLAQVGSDAAARNAREAERDREQRATEAQTVELLQETSKALRMVVQKVAA